MQETLKPAMSLKAQRIDHACALIADGRVCGATARLSVGRLSPGVADGGALAPLGPMAARSRRCGAAIRSRPTFSLRAAGGRILQGPRTWAITRAPAAPAHARGLLCLRP
jgi:hypothetical protein